MTVGETTNFDEKARDWDSPERRARAVAVATAIRQSVPLSPTARVIEVGAGTGLLGLELAGEVGELVLAEPSHGMLKVTAEKLECGVYPNVSAVRFDLVTDAAPGDGQFDLAISLLVLHHLADTAAALSAVRELLRPGGWMALADLDTEEGFHDPGEEGIHHPGFDREAIAGLARSVGFEDVSVRTATTIDRDGQPYSVFLLAGRRG